MSERICTVDDCDSPICNREPPYCFKHYRRWQKRGTTDDPIKAAPRPKRQCIEPDCSAPVIGRDVCEKHYRAQRLAQAPPCSIEGCDRQQRSMGWCNRHYKRWNVRGTTEWEPPAPAENYIAMHARIPRHLGLAADHWCHDCGERAQEWSYDHTDSDDLTETDPITGASRTYSLDYRRYVPRCIKCHRAFDNTYATPVRHGRTQEADGLVQQMLTASATRETMTGT